MSTGARTHYNYRFDRSSCGASAYLMMSSLSLARSLSLRRCVRYVRWYSWVLPTSESPSCASYLFRSLAPLCRVVLTGVTGPPIQVLPNMRFLQVVHKLLSLTSALGCGTYTDIITRHAMFGVPTVGVLVMPMHDTKSRLTQSAGGISIDTCCSRTMRSPLRIGRNECWMTKTTSYKINKPDQRGQTVVWKSFKAVRIISISHGSHRCALGCSERRRRAGPFRSLLWSSLEATDPAQMGYCCINGAEHGIFTNRLTNEERKLCKNGARVLCRWTCASI